MQAAFNSIHSRRLCLCSLAWDLHSATPAAESNESLLHLSSSEFKQPAIIQPLLSVRPSVWHMKK